MYEEYTDVVIAFGFNDTIGGTRQQALANYAFFGIKCVHPLGIAPGLCVQPDGDPPAAGAAEWYGT